MNKKILAIALLLSLTLMLLVPLGSIARAMIPNANTITYATIGGPDATGGTDPAWAYDTSSSTMIQQVYQPLYMYNNMSTANFEPMLADWWYGYKGTTTYTKSGFTNSSGPLAITLAGSNITMLTGLGFTVPSWATVAYLYHIRPNVKWQNASYTTVKPSDVVYSIQRVFLLDAPTGVQWLLTTPMLGVSSISAWYNKYTGLWNYNGTAGNPGPNTGGVSNMTSLGNAVENMVQGNNGNGYVVFYLWATYTPFAQILTQSWAMVTCQTWVTQNGGINTNIAGLKNNPPALTNNPLNYTEFLGFLTPSVSPLIEPSVISQAYPMMGSGPYIIKTFNPDPHVGYQDYIYNPNYWGEWPVTVPSWSGTDPSTITLPTAPYTPNSNYNGTNSAQEAAVKAAAPSYNVLGFAPYVVIEVVESWSSREFMLLSTTSTQVDLADVPTSYAPVLYTQTSRFPNNAYLLPGLSETNVSMLEADYFYYCYDVASAGGMVPTFNGAPDSTMFDNEYAREAINYLLNETEYLAQAWIGMAVQPKTYICDGILYYNKSVPVRAFNVREALADLYLAGWYTGTKTGNPSVYFDCLYNAGNIQRQIVTSMLSTEISEIDTTYGTAITLNPVAAPWADYLTEMMSSECPTFIVGWLTDYPDPDDWAQPFMLPTYGTYAGLSQSIGVGTTGYGNSSVALNAAWSTMNVNSTNTKGWPPTFGPIPYTSSLAGYPGCPYGTVDQINDTYVTYLITTAPTIPNGPTRQGVYEELMDIFYAENQGFPLDQPIGMHFERLDIRMDRRVQQQPSSCGRLLRPAVEDIASCSQ